MHRRSLIVVVDDLRRFPVYEDMGEVRYAREEEAGIALLEELCSAGGHIDLLSLDHDLGPSAAGPPRDIRPLVLWIVERCVWGHEPDIGRIVAHSANPVGSRFIAQSLQRWYDVSIADAAALGALA